MEQSRYRHFEDTLESLREGANLRSLPGESTRVTDFTSNDYLGFAADAALKDRFFSTLGPVRADWPSMTSSASRLLAGDQRYYQSLEDTIVESYRLAGSSSGQLEAVVFNSGYHANTGIIPVVAEKGDVILSDKLSHASIIDGCRLSKAKVVTFPHNDLEELEKLVQLYSKDETVGRILTVVESIYSMDGDTADLCSLAALRRKYPKMLLYVDEAHGIGVRGPGGLGEAMASGVLDDVDFLIGTFGKALASEGAFALVKIPMRCYLINKVRSLIFSTALPPMQVRWSEFVWRHSLEADSERKKLEDNARLLARFIPGGVASHIRPLIVGDAGKAVRLSAMLKEESFNVLPIRTPSVPPGTERLRFSVSASIPSEEILRLGEVLIKQNL